MPSTPRNPRGHKRRSLVDLVTPPPRNTRPRRACQSRVVSVDNASEDSDSEVDISEEQLERGSDHATNSLSASAAASASSLVTDASSAATPEQQHNLQRRTTNYEPCWQTLFLSASDFTTFMHSPVKSRLYASSYHVDLLKPHYSNIHKFFVSPNCAGAAAARSGPLLIYRHIGQVFLPKFQEKTGIPRTHKWFKRMRSSTPSKNKMYSFWPVVNGKLNLRYALISSWSTDHQLLDCLQSLCHEQSGRGWKSPFVVALAKRDDVIRACDLKTYKDDFDLPVQIYASRLLFELIACDDIRTLFSRLTPAMGVVPPTPQLPPRLSHFHKSPRPSASDDQGKLLADLLRHAESTGYETLSPEHDRAVSDAISVPLYEYQKQTVRWMIDKESDKHALNDYFWQEWRFTDSHYHPGGSFYYFPLKGELRLCRPPSTRGGMVTEEMGLGKTVEALALIAAQKRPDYKPHHVTVTCAAGRKPSNVTMTEDGVFRVRRVHVANKERSAAMLEEGATSGGKTDTKFRHGDSLVGNFVSWKSVKVLRWESKTTLVLCPPSLLPQWHREARQRAPSLRVHVWKSGKDESCQDGSSADVAIGPSAVDVVLATYDMVRKDATLSKVFWQRVILDEAQVTRRSATQVAKDVFNLRCHARFLMTGTPFVNSLDDLKGQLAILKIWPFTLEQDGFWEQYISTEGFADTDLAKKLLDVVMIRHSKGQNLQLTLPPRTYETVKVSMKGSSRALYNFLLGCCLEDIEQQYSVRNNGELDTRRLRVLFRQLLLVCLSPKLFDAPSIDLVRREGLSRGQEVQDDSGENDLAAVSAKEAILYVAETRSGIVRDSARNRTAANHVTVAEEAERASYEAMELDELRGLVSSLALTTMSAVSNASRNRLVQLAMGGVHRLEGDTLRDLRATAVREGIVGEEEVRGWSKARTIANLRLQYDWLNSQKRGGPVAGDAQQDSAFASMMKLIECKKEHPSCPVCLADCEERIAVTKCGHLYCLDCIHMMLNRGKGNSFYAKCAICRRPLHPDRPVEIVRDEKIGAEEESEDDGESSEGSEVEEVVALRRRSTRLSIGRRSLGTTGRSGERRNSEIGWKRPTAKEVMKKFSKASVPESVAHVRRNALFPLLDRKVMQHLSHCRSSTEAAPKLEALLNIILESEASTKFCVVAGSVKSLEAIRNFLEEFGVKSVGIGSKTPSGQKNGRRSDTEEFESDDEVRVYLLRPSQAAGLTLTRASVVVFMELLPRVADEVQAAARVHRIGQTKAVRVIRIVAKDTVEEVVGRERLGEVKSAEDEWKALCAVSDSSSHDAADGLLRALFGFPTC